MVAKIESLQHPKVKEFVQLRISKEARANAQSVLISGEKMVRELAASVPIKYLLTTESQTQIPANERIITTEQVLQKITGLPTTDGFAAVLPLPHPRDVSRCKRLLILDALSDPGNLGTLLRTALALNWDGVVFTPGTVDPFNDKALRASKGAIFFLPYSFLSPEEFTTWKHNPYVADLDGTPLNQCKPTAPIALILSNEAKGPAPWAEKWGRKISIPMYNKVESLNVASSGAILLYELGKE